MAGRGTRTADLAASLPSPDTVADKVTRLREAMYAKVSEADVGEMMAALMAKAKGGHTGAAKLIIDMVSPSRGGTKVMQQAVYVSMEDAG